MLFNGRVLIFWGLKLELPRSSAYSPYLRCLWPRCRLEDYVSAGESSLILSRRISARPRVYDWSAERCPFRLRCQQRTIRSWICYTIITNSHIRRQIQTFFFFTFVKSDTAVTIRCLCLRSTNNVYVNDTHVTFSDIQWHSERPERRSITSIRKITFSEIDRNQNTPYPRNVMSCERIVTIETALYPNGQKRWRYLEFHRER